ncbi:transcriptional regulator [Hapalosiphon sp. MRB220]|nr:transcriptional regulator [Hapalosiphon sp. MRB220]
MVVDIINKSKIDKFAQKTRAMDKRITKLYENFVINLPVLPHSVPQVLFELGSASQTLHYAVEELYQQNEQLEKVQEILAAELYRYQELFEEAPDGYCITDVHGKIQLANRKFARLLNIEQHYLIGKIIINFVALEERKCFRNFLSQLIESGRSQKLVTCLQQRSGGLFEVAFTVSVSYDNQGKPQNLRWLLRPNTERRSSELTQIKKGFDFSDRPIHKCSKGETILLDQQTIWYVYQGVVKLTTLCESNEETLVGLADQGMIFGSYMTSLNIYQATAMSEVKLVAIKVSEITACPNLSYFLLPKFNQRLRQTEAFLAVSGFRRVEDRLYYLLRLLKQEIGENLGNDTRIPIRFIHEDFASACCTTRVTITRLLCKLKHQGKITFDAKRHIIVKNIE